MEALKGAQTTLPKFNYVITEASVMERFENSCRMPALIEFMQERGYMLEAILDAPVDKRGLIKVADLLFKSETPRARSWRLQNAPTLIKAANSGASPQ